MCGDIITGKQRRESFPMHVKLRRGRKLPLNRQALIASTNVDKVSKTRLKLIMSSQKHQISQHAAKFHRRTILKL